MKKILILLIIFISSSVNAQLLWEISGNGLKEKSYIYGTIHMICADDFNFSENLKKAFDNTKQCVLEIDMDDPNFMLETQKLSMNKGMKNIYNDISEADKKIINDFFTKNFGMNLTQLGVMKPFVLVSMVTTKFLNCSPKSYEGDFVQLSKQQKEEVLGLETIKEQIDIFDNLPKEKQIAMLVETIKTFKEGKQAFDKLLNSYKKGDLNMLLEIAKKDPQFKELRNVLLDDRNKKWIPKIKKIMSEKATIFGVGAAHLGGENGVINLLKKESYKVTPVK